jgi:hypothetical protein
VIRVAKRRKRKEREIIGFLGLGLDNKDGHDRITKSEHFLLVGGSTETHERMQDTAIRFDEGLRKRGKSLPETSIQEVFEILREAQDD